MHGLMMDTPLLITEIMRFAERNFADREVVSVTFDNPRHRTTLGAVFRRARKLANALQAAGVKQGDRVATLAWNDYRHLELYYAVSCMGAVPRIVERHRNDFALGEVAFGEPHDLGDQQRRIHHQAMHCPFPCS